MMHQATKMFAPVKPGLVYLLDRDTSQDVIRVLAVKGDYVCFEHLDWTLDDGWEPKCDVCSGSTRRLEQRLQSGYQLVPWSAGNLMDIVFRDV